MTIPIFSEYLHARNISGLKIWLFNTSSIFRHSLYLFLIHYLIDLILQSYCEIFLCRSQSSFYKILKICLYRSNSQKKQEVQGLQVFAFSVVTVHDEHTKPRFRRKRRG